MNAMFIINRLHPFLLCLKTFDHMGQSFMGAFRDGSLTLKGVVVNLIHPGLFSILILGISK